MLAGMPCTDTTVQWILQKFGSVSVREGEVGHGQGIGACAGHNGAAMSGASRFTGNTEIE